MAPREVMIDGHKLDLLTLAVHSGLLFLGTFLTTLAASPVAALASGRQADGRAVVVEGLVYATVASLSKVTFYLASRTGAPLEGATQERSR